MEADTCPSHLRSRRRRNRSLILPPYMCEELRIVLLGKNGLNSRVGNFLLGRDAFDTEAPPPSVEQHSERARGTVKGRCFTLINTPHLFDPQLTQDQITEQITESMTLCSPGPHVLIVVLQPDDFTETDRDRLYYVLFSLSEEAPKHTLVLMTQKLEPRASVDPVQENMMKEIIARCSNRHVDLKSGYRHADLVERMQKMVEQNRGRCLISKKHWELARDVSSVSTSTSKTLKPLNLVLCGKDRAVKASLSKLLLERKTSRFQLGHREHSADPSSVPVKREGEVCGQLITLVELPALYSTRLSEEEMMRETLHCVSLCNPGVHAFLLLVPVGPLMDEDKGEMEKMRRIFSPRINENLIVFFTTEYNTNKRAAAEFVEQSSEMKHFLRTCRGYRVLEKMEDGNLKPESELLDEIVNMVTSSKYYSLEMFTEAQKGGGGLERELDAEVNTVRKQQTCDKPSGSACLRIVLIGKTGNGKSSTGNTILGRNEFQSRASMSSVTTMCRKGFGIVLGQSVAVVDTPGLFDTTLTSKEVTEELVRCISLSAPGPHAFIIVLSVGRITKEEMDTLELIRDIFGPGAVKFSIVLFTRADELEDETTEEFIRTSDHAGMNKLMMECGGRVYMFNNREKENRTQVEELLKGIEEMIKFNRSNYFRNDMLELAERSIQLKKEEILRKREKEIQEKEKSLKTQHEKELEKKEHQLKRERGQVEEKRLQRAKVFEEREEALRREHEMREVERSRRTMEKAAFIKEQSRGTKTKKWEMWEQHLKGREHRRTNLKPAEERREQFSRNTEQDQLPSPSEREEWKEPQRRERRGRDEENRMSELQMLKEEPGKEGEDGGSDRMSEEDRKMLEKLELEREWQEELRKREEEDRVRRQKEEKEHEEMKKAYEERLNELKTKYEEEARHQAELLNDVTTQLENKILKLLEKHQDKGKVKTSRSCPSETAKKDHKTNKKCVLL